MYGAILFGQSKSIKRDLLKAEFSMFRAPKLLGNVQIVRKLKQFFFVKALGNGILPIQLPLFSLFPTAVLRLKQK